MSVQVSLAGPDVTLGMSGEDAGDIVARSPTALFWRRFREDRVAVASLIFIVVLVIIAVAAPLVVKLFGLPGPYVQNLNLTNAFGEPLGPSAAHPFGVDGLGEDIASRVIYGSRVSLEVGVIGTGIATVIGVSASASPATKPPRRPKRRRTRSYTSATVAIPISACGTRMLSE